MLKEYSNCVVNDRKAVFNASVERGLISLYPIAIFTFENGEVIKVKHNIITGNTSVTEGRLDPESMIRYHNGQWEFIRGY
ncbi:Hypothetical protein KNT65_gp107 [Escherichia phage EcS1]|uniref:Uncharacterized protein n=1 Tax=Escherichia phage EcS1 TaxID=2083276 RepID=A0A2Z5ZCF9_9CAUD|nr:Hypothetical protein KNT65_gp107 [Escherichia phage EcS1]BBC78155.1 Hypothetical protein [Escherichia phage EcS1]